MTKKSGAKLWGGRFSKPTDPAVESYTSSLAVDVKLARHDVIGSIAHAKMLGHCGIIAKAESAKLVEGLKAILKTIEAGGWRIDPKAEDVHTQVQQELEKRIGETARKIHTGRSRNDQVCLDLRLYCREAVVNVSGGIAALQRALVGLAADHQEVVIPGYTHLQRAQPVSVAHHLLAYVEMLERDAERLEDAYKRIDVMPLGSGALAGSSLPLDRAFVAEELGFERIAVNSMDAVADRDFAVELVCDLVQIALHLSRLAEDAILWAGEEFGLLALDDAFATGSSLMPQKKNPDVLELARGQAAVLIGHATGFFSLMKAQPLAYNRDLQWDKTFVFDAVEKTEAVLDVLARLFAASTFRRDAAARLLQSDGLCATDLAEYLVGRGVAFRDAHAMAGGVVAYAEQSGKRLADLSLEELRRFAPACGEDALKLFDPRRSIARKQTFGSTAPREIKRQLAKWKKKLA